MVIEILEHPSISGTVLLRAKQKAKTGRVQTYIYFDATYDSHRPVGEVLKEFTELADIAIKRHALREGFTL